MSGLSRMRYEKKILAMILSVALVMGSGDFTLFVNAANAAGSSSMSATGSDGEDAHEALYSASHGGGDVESSFDGDDETEFCIIENGSLQLKWDAIEKAAEATEDHVVEVIIPRNVEIINAGIFDISEDNNPYRFKLAILIPKGSKLTTIGEGAFLGSAIIQSLTVSAGVHIKKIGNRAFAESSLAAIAFLSNDAGAATNRMMRAADEDTARDKNASDSDDSDTGSRDGDDNALTWGDYVFQDCEGLNTVILPEDTTKITRGMFKNCVILENIKIPAGVTIIEEEAFQNCTALSGNVVLPKVQTIGQGAFQACGVGKVIFGAEDLKLAAIPDDAFHDCVNLSEISIPESCTYIGSSAFEGCTSLSGTVMIPGRCVEIGSSAFKGCSNIAQINLLAEDLKEIGREAFYGCTKLQTVEIYQHSNSDSDDGESTITLWEVSGEGSVLWDVFDQTELTLWGYDGTVKAYADAKNGTAIPGALDGAKYSYHFQTLFEQNKWFKVDGKGVLRIKKGMEEEFAAFNGTVELLATAKEIPNDIFYNHIGITGLIVPEGSCLETIAPSAFEGSGITEFTVPRQVKEIAKGTFRDAKIKTVTFEKGSLLESIGDSAFSGSDLKEIKLPYTVEREDGDEDSENPGSEEPILITINARAFYHCAKLETISLRAVKEVGGSAFADCGSLSTIQWGSDLVFVGNSAFAKCAFTSLDLTILDPAGENANTAKTVTWGSGVFEGCANLRTVTLPKSMQTIPANLFKDCTALTTLSLPDNCTVISQRAFSGCSSLVMVDIPAKVATIREKAFADCKSLIMVTIRQQGAGEGSESTVFIAEDAFPVMKLTMCGYDGTVQTYASLKGYTFRSLFANYTVSLLVKNSSYGEATLSKETARSGETIEVTVTPKLGYRLKASSFQYNGISITKLKTSTAQSKTFTFRMPDKDTVVTVEFEKDEAYGKLSASFEQINNMPYLWDADKKMLTFAESGLAARLVVLGEKSNPGCWELTYSSSNSKVVRVDSEGIVYAMGKGSADVTATLKSDPTQKVKFTVNVLEDLEIVSVKLEFSNFGSKVPLRYRESFGTGDGEDSEDGEDSGDGGEEDLYVLEYDKSALQQAEQNFTVELIVKGRNNTASMNHYAKSEWKSSNTGMVTVDQATAYDNKNIVRIKKGVTGETCVTVTVGKMKRSVIIRVIDSTPRLVQSTLTLNARSTTPKAAFELISVYGYQVDPGSLKVVQAVKKDGITNYEEWEYAKISDTHTDADKYYLELTQEGKTAIAVQKGDKTYKDIYIYGSCKKVDGNNVVEKTFYVPIKSVVLTNKALKPRVKLNGRINLFYKAQAGEDKCGIVTIDQSLKDLEVKTYRLLSAENYKAGRYKDPNETLESGNDALADNFQVSEKGQITRTGNELVKVKKKAVTSGYLGILYDGYDEFCWVKITIPAKTTKPSYVLSKTKATVSAGSTGYPIQLKLLDKKTKAEISLTVADLETGVDLPADIALNHSSSKTTPGLFYDFGETSGSGSYYYEEDSIIELRLDTVQNGKATINVQMPDWSEPLAYTFKVKVAKGKPKVRPKSSTLTLNMLSQADTFTPLTLKPDDVTLIGLETELLTGARNEEDAVDPGIDLGYDEDTGRLTVSGGDSEAKGKYRFRVRPKVRYFNGEEGDATPFTITVKVVETAMSVKLKRSTVTVNRLYVGLDKQEVGYTVQNMPAGDSIGELKMEGLNDASRAVEDSLDFQPSGDKIQVSLKNQSVSAGTYKFRAAEPQTESGAPLRPFTITVKVVEKVAKIKVKASGSINMLNEKSSIKYTLTASNVNVTLGDDNLIVRELDTTNGRNKPYVDSSTGEYFLKHFQYEIIEEKGKKLVKVSAKTAEDGDGEEEEAAITSGIYKLQFGLRVDPESNTESGSESGPGTQPGTDPGTNPPSIQAVGREAEQGGSQIIWSKDVNIKPKQTLPKIKTDVTETTLYAGVGVTSARRSQEFQVVKTSVQEAVINDVCLAKGNSEYVQEAFRISEFDSETQSVKITLLRPDLLKPNTTYTVKMEAHMKGQISGSAGAPFIVKIRVAN